MQPETIASQTNIINDHTAQN